VSLYTPLRRVFPFGVFCANRRNLVLEPALADRSHAWVRAYNETVEEKDFEKLHERVLEAEAAIFHRWQELTGLPDGSAEMNALEGACAQLLKIKTERLMWPGLDLLKSARRLRNSNSEN
jgi:hypothetical protein